MATLKLFSFFYLHPDDKSFYIIQSHCLLGVLSLKRRPVPSMSPSHCQVKAKISQKESHEETEEGEASACSSVESTSDLVAVWGIK